jgi:hypothetical protein
MSKRRKWTEEGLRKAVGESYSIRAVLIKIGLKPAGGNYSQVNKYIKELSLSTKHFTGQGWNVGLKFIPKKRASLNKILIENGSVQSYKLKNRLFEEGLKEKKCEICGWAQMSPDGRIPLEINHKNGVSSDNRIGNLEILCPNCHSLKPFYRGRNKKN